MNELSPEIRETILRLLRDGIDSSEIARQVNEPITRIAAVKANLTRGTYDKIDDTEILDDLEATTETTFGLERDLQNALRSNIEQLERGLVIADNNKEQVTASGRIDITARDQSGAMVIIELKAGSADRDAIAQVLSYIGDAMEKEKSVRGIVIAGDLTPRAIAAARAAAIRLVKYGFNFSFKTISSSLS
jgi:RecB family endonuclease NucS